MKRGDIYFAALDPTVGPEIRKTRPCLIVSNNDNNAVARMVTVVPLTSKLTQVRAFEVAVPKSRSGLPKDSKALIPQLRSIAAERLVGSRAGRLDDELMSGVNSALRLHLALD